MVLTICAVLIPLGGHFHHVFVEPHEIRSPASITAVPGKRQPPPKEIGIASCRPTRDRLEPPPSMRDSFEMLQEDMAKEKYSQIFVAQSDVLGRYKPFVITVGVPDFSPYRLHVANIYLMRKLGDEEFWWTSEQDLVEIRHAESGDNVFVLLAFSGTEKKIDETVCKHLLRVNLGEVRK